MLGALGTSCGGDERAPPPGRSAAENPRLLFVGLDGADWTHLDPLMARGTMPNLARLVASSASGVLDSELPLLSPIVWTTMMTGRSPLEHRVLDFTRFDAATGAREPIGSDERRVPAVWNVASDRDRSVAVFGLWATFPAEAVKGLLVTDRFLTATAPLAGSVYPPEREPWAIRLRTEAAGAIDLPALREIVPDATAEERQAAIASPERWTDPVTGAFHLLARTESVRQLANDWLTGNEWDLAIVYFEGTDTIGHLFGRYAPPRLPGVDEARYRRFHETPERYFARIDAIVGELAAIAERANATLVLASDHGFEWGGGRPTTSSSDDATAATWHRPDGIYLLHGPRIARSGGHGGRGDSRQIAATLLSLAGLFPTIRMATPLAEAGPAPPASDYPDGAAQRVAQMRANDSTSAEELARLAALGYLSSADAKDSNKGKKERPHAARTAASLSNEASILEREGDVASAARLYAAAVEQEPESAAAMWNLSNFLFERGREPERSDELLARAFAGRMTEAERLVVDRARRLASAGDRARAHRLLDRSIELLPEEIGPRLVRGQMRVSGGDCRGGSDDFSRVLKVDPEQASAWGALGLARLCLGDAAGARNALRRAVALAPERLELGASLAKLESAARQ